MLRLAALFLGLATASAQAELELGTSVLSGDSTGLTITPSGGPTTLVGSLAIQTTAVDGSESRAYLYTGGGGDDATLTLKDSNEVAGLYLSGAGAIKASSTATAGLAFGTSTVSFTGASFTDGIDVSAASTFAGNIAMTTTAVDGSESRFGFSMGGAADNPTMTVYDSGQTAAITLSGSGDMSATGSLGLGGVTPQCPLHVASSLTLPGEKCIGATSQRATSDSWVSLITFYRSRTSFAAFCKVSARILSGYGMAAKLEADIFLSCQSSGGCAEGFSTRANTGNEWHVKYSVAGSETFNEEGANIDITETWDAGAGGFLSIEGAVNPGSFYLTDNDGTSVTLKYWQAASSGNYQNYQWDFDCQYGADNPYVDELTFMPA